jgi:hypothetical protein
MDTLKVTAKRKQIPVELELEAGVVEQLVLQELVGSERGQYLNTMSKRMKFDDTGKPVGVSTFDGLEAALLSLCLVDKDGQKVSQERIQALPSSTVSVLFTEAQKMNGLGAPGEAASKNS